MYNDHHQMKAYAYKSVQIYKKILMSQRFFHFFTQIHVFFSDFVRFFYFSNANTYQIMLLGSFAERIYINGEC